MLLNYSFWASIVTPALAMRTTPQRSDWIVDGEPTGVFAAVTAALSINPRAR